MDWKEYVGETFKGPDNLLYEAEAYDPRYGFRLTQLDNPTKKVKVSTEEISERYQYIFGPQTKPMIRSLKNTDDSHALLDRAVLNLHLNVPISEIVSLFREDGWSDYDIYLTIKGAEILAKS